MCELWKSWSGGSTVGSPAENLRWPRPLRHVQLNANEIHVWCAAISSFRGKIRSFEVILSPDEQERATSFRFSQHRDSYVIRRGILRTILSRYLRRAPSEIEFSYGSTGKPTITKPTELGSLHFNDSHSEDLAIYAMARACDVGVDVEYLKPIPNLKDILPSCFSPREIERLRNLTAERQVEAFYTGWICKEAVLKATGEGIGRGMTHLEVLVNFSHETEILEIRRESEGLPNWLLRSVRPAAGYLAAIAYQHPELNLTFYRVPADLKFGCVS
jgi:4'-phosphopantetheinyl transferase